MSDTSARLDLPLIKPSQAQKHVTHNEALQVLDGLVQTALEGVDEDAPPLDPDPGDLYALGSAPTGDWADQNGMLAYRSGIGWLFIAPREGWHAWDKGTGEFKVYRSGVWEAFSNDLSNLTELGVNATPDAVNRLSVASEAVLLNHDGAGHQLKVNKASVGDTASLLFQSGFTGHAEMGLAGETAFSIKVSADGTTWADALKADAAAGELRLDLPVTGAAVQQGLDDATPDRLVKTGAAATVMNGGLESRVSFGGTGDTISLTSQAGFSTVPVGYRVRFRASSANSGPATLDIDSTGLVDCVTISGEALPPGYLRTDADTVAEFDGTNWIVDRQIERGVNANGYYTRYADGTQMIMSRPILDYFNPAMLQGTVTFPATFVNSPSLSPNFSLIGFTNSTVKQDMITMPRCNAFTTTQCNASLDRMAGGISFQPGDFIRVNFYASGNWY